MIDKWKVVAAGKLFRVSKLDFPDILESRIFGIADKIHEVQIVETSKRKSGIVLLISKCEY